MKEVFETNILPNLVNFIKKNYNNIEQKTIQGEFFTLIRRHTPDLVKPKANYSIGLENIDHIGIDREGNIITIGFSNTHFGYNGAAKKDIIKELNDILKSIEFKFNGIILSHKLDSITDSLKFSQF
tara:strand:+ start:7296 stop:7673 length:378 start_codon:yes stop_codon:yes gene_type:complete